jgi:hypothetical protein
VSSIDPTSEPAEARGSRAGSSSNIQTSDGATRLDPDSSLRPQISSQQLSPSSAGGPFTGGRQRSASVQSRSSARLKDMVPQPDGKSAIAAGLFRATSNLMDATPAATVNEEEVPGRNRVNSAHHAEAGEGIKHTAPPPTHRARLPGPGGGWADTLVGDLWDFAVARQQQLRDQLASQPQDVRRLAPALAVDLRTVEAGTQLEFAAATNIPQMYRHFRAACQGTVLHLNDGQTQKTRANVLLPVLLGFITKEVEFADGAHVGGRPPMEVLASLIRFRAPLDPALSETLRHLLATDPELCAELGASALISMEQQTAFGWKTVFLWAVSVGAALGFAASEKPTEESIRDGLGLGVEDIAQHGGEQFALGAGSATTSGDAEATDGLVIDLLEKATEGERPVPDWDAPLQMLKSWVMGTVSALPSAWLSFSTLSRAAKIGLGLPFNLIAAAGGGAPMPIILQKRADHQRGTMVEKAGSERFLRPMGLPAIGRLVDFSIRVSTNGQILQKGGFAVVLAGFVTWLVQTGTMDESQAIAYAQRALLNPIEAHALLVGALFSEYVSFLGATRAQKSERLSSAIVRNRMNGNTTTMGQVIRIHEPGGARHIQTFGRGVATGLNVVINGGEDATRAVLGKLTFGWVRPHMRYRLQDPTAGGAEMGTVAGTKGVPAAPLIQIEDHPVQDTKGGPGP